jgi:ATP-GRASP peptide maturase of grasp-with-spasm system
MVLILSQSFEQTTIEVIDWIDHLGGRFHRINGVDFCRDVKIEVSNSGSSISLNKVEWSEIDVVWFWRWIGFDERHSCAFKQDPDNIDTVKLQLNHLIKAELKSLLEFFFISIPKPKKFSRIDVLELNKLEVLRRAQELEIDIPNTYILTRRKHFEEVGTNTALITKAISNAPFIDYKNECYQGFTAVVDNLPNEFESSFCPSLFQNHIQKKYEIRSFLLNDEFYSMAIFSQSDAQTAVDFRVYNYFKPNRTVPFKLPKSLEKKLLNLAKSFELESGSFDIIKTTDNKYVFLEINSAGQFGMVSKPCNYYLEKKVSAELLKRGSK